MIKSFDVPDNEVGRCVGILSAIFSVRLVLYQEDSPKADIVPEAKVSPLSSVAEHPIILAGNLILIGLAVTMFASVIFGFARSLPEALIARSIAGGCSGNIGVLRTTVAEMVPWKHLQPRAFSIMPLVWSLGSILGPMIGGALAEPAEKYPAQFGESSLLKKFPYAFPNVVASVFFIVGVVVGVLFLEETLETKKHRKDYGLVIGELILRPCGKKRRKPPGTFDESASPIAKKAPAEGEAPPRFRDVFTPQSNLNLATYCVLALHSIAYDQLDDTQDDRPTNPHVQLPFKFSGGLGVGTGRTGLIFSIYGLVAMLVQFFVFPPVARRYGVLNCLKVCTFAFPTAYFITPFTALFENPLTQQISLCCVMLIKAAGNVFAFPCCIIMLTNSARSLRLLGTLNGISVSLSAIGRAIGPALAGSLYDLGAETGYGVISWFTLGTIGVAGHMCTYWLIEMDGFAESTGDGNDEVCNSDESQPLSIPSSEIENEGSSRGVMTEDGIIADEPVEEYRGEEQPLLSRGQGYNTIGTTKRTQ